MDFSFNEMKVDSIKNISKNEYEIRDIQKEKCFQIVKITQNNIQLNFLNQGREISRYINEFRESNILTEKTTKLNHLFDIANTILSFLSPESVKFSVKIYDITSIVIIQKYYRKKKKIEKEEIQMKSIYLKNQRNSCALLIQKWWRKNWIKKVKLKLITTCIKTYLAKKKFEKIRLESENYIIFTQKDQRTTEDLNLNFNMDTNFDISFDGLNDETLSNEIDNINQNTKIFSIDPIKVNDNCKMSKRPMIPQNIRKTDIAFCHKAQENKTKRTFEWVLNYPRNDNFKELKIDKLKSKDTIKIKNDVRCNENTGNGRNRKNGTTKYDNTFNSIRKNKSNRINSTLYDKYHMTKSWNTGKL
ncbi:hypothetical protein A3Q56_00024 [Intoshia linei]|uniref:Uncharacterized protein n=1 Tax=Intoshia linei TaxID=1819745 RepID=A0A177BD26_9BILA|nr:hypothetical protein A3Q56_00024 [Intoshia linei]